MGRWGGKDTTEGYRTITTKFLKQYNYLIDHRHNFGSINWSRNGEKAGSVSFEVSTIPGDEYIRFEYTSTDRVSGEKKDYGYKVNLASINCNYGGKRWFFNCPYCRKRVGVLYVGGSEFACRHCYNLTYASRNESRRGDIEIFRKLFKAESIEE